MQRVIIMCFVLLSPHVMAFGSDGSGYKILAQVKKQLDEMKKSLKEAKKAVNISQNLEKLEQAKTYQESITNVFDDLKTIHQEAKSLKSEFDDLIEDPFDTSHIGSDVEWYDKILRDVKDEPARVKVYGGVLMDLKNLEFMRKQQDKKLQIMADGTNEKEESKIQTDNSMIMTDILIRNEQRAVNSDKNNSDVLLESLGGSGFDRLGK